MKHNIQKIGLITTTSLVIGNMIGAGIYVLPATLAGYGSVSILGWALTALGALVLARIFGNFSKMIVNKSGGPYTYTKEGFGDFVAYLVAWGYWISIWISNAAVAIAAVSALSVFFPALEDNGIYTLVIGLSLIWFFTWINSRGVKTSGKVQLLTTIVKVLPLLGISVIGLFYFDLENFPSFNLTAESDLATVPVVASMTLYAFLGIECATIPAENVKDPERTVPRATMLGSILTTLIYIIVTVVLFGMLPAEELMQSPAPMAEASKLIAGDYAAYIVGAGAAISAIGALNGWILISGQIPMAASRDNLFPRVFKRENDKGAPAIGIIIGSILTSLVMFTYQSDSLVEQFELIMKLTVLTALIPYLFVSASYLLVVMENKWKTPKIWRTVLLSLLGFSYSLWAIYGSGQDSVFYGFILLLLSIPFYILMRYNQKKKP